MMYRARSAGLGLAVIGFAALWPSLAAGQRSDIPFSNDNHFFRFLLEQLKVQALENIADAAQDPERTVLIVFGAVGPNQVPPDVVEFVKAGGSVLIATKQFLDEDIEDRLGVSVRGKSVAVPKDSEAAYRNNPQFPIVKPVSGSKEPWHGLKRVASNWPSYLQVRNPQLRVIAEFPEDRIPLEPDFVRRRFPGNL